jgi:cysteine desulfurase
MNRIYVDYAATTPLDPRVFEAMRPYFTSKFGNASSINAFGLEAKRALDDARKSVAEFIGVTADELVFTGSATEANNMILKGVAFKQGKTNTHIAVSTIEHDCVLNTAKWLENQGYSISYIPVNREGLLNLGKLEEALISGASFVSIIHANNEIGTIQPMHEIGALCREYGALLHTDAAQSFGKIPIDVYGMNIDAMTVNAHKIYGPKGVGALFVRKDLAFEPLLHGGGHEFGFRASTENVPGIVGFARAVELREMEMQVEGQRLAAYGEHLLTNILRIEDTCLNGHPTQRLHHILNFNFAYIEGEALLLLLNDAGIAVSTGSACSSRSNEPSHVLKAIGLPPEKARGSLRLSLGKYNTKEELEYILDALPRAVYKLREISPLGKL